MSAIIDTLISTLQSVPENWQCRLALVEALIGENRYDEAVAVLNQVAELPADTESQMMAAKAYGLVDPTSGLEVLDAIIAADPTCALAYFQKAQLCFSVGDLDLANRQYNAAVTMDQSLVDPDFVALLAKGISTQSTAATGAPTTVQPPAPTAPPVAEPVPLQPPTETDANASPPPPPPTAVPHNAAEPLDRGNVVYPEPGQYPTITLAESLESSPNQPLVDPAAIPAAPPLVFNENPMHTATVHTSDEQFLEQVHDVAVYPAPHPEGFAYDYQNPDTSIFDPTITEDDIYVGALVTESGEPVASLQESIRRAKAEKEAERLKRIRNDKFQSVIVACLTMILVCVLMFFAVSSVPRPNPPQIVASSLAPPSDDEMDQQTMVKQQPTPKPSASASAMSLDVMTVASASDINMISFDMPTSDFGVGLSTDFGASMSFGNELGGGSVMFFGGKSTGKRFLFILDDSMSMRRHQVKLRNEELEKTFRTLKGVQYQVILFAGGAYFAQDGWGFKAPPGNKGRPSEYFSPDGGYTFDRTGLVGKLKPPKWRDASSSSKRETLNFVKNAKLFWGTDWGKAFEVGFEMKPPPDVIFFMSDGTGNTSEEAIAKANRSNGKAKINTLAMQTGSGAKAFYKIAKDSGGEFNIVDKDGKLIDGEEYMKDPASFAGKLK